MNGLVKPEDLEAAPVKPVDCPACAEGRAHTEEDWKHHPYKGHGFVSNQGWTHPDLQAEAEKREALAG
jgi:hypothetical protein